MLCEAQGAYASNFDFTLRQAKMGIKSVAFLCVNCLCQGFTLVIRSKPYILYNMPVTARTVVKLGAIYHVYTRRSGSQVVKFRFVHSF